MKNFLLSIFILATATLTSQAQNYFPEAGNWQSKTPKDLGKQGQGLIAVAGKDDFVENGRLFGSTQVHLVVGSFDTEHRAVQADTVDKPCGQGLYIAARATFNSVPLRPVGYVEQAMIIKKPDKKLQRKIHTAFKAH